MASNCFRIHIRKLATAVDNKLNYTHLFNPKITPPCQAWLETFVDRERQLLGILDLHPRIFSVFPRIDYVSKVVTWQKEYRTINYVTMPTRYELPGHSKKPWPQKGTGRAQAGCIRAPQFNQGGWAKGPRGPVTGYRIEPHFRLVNAMRSMLTLKLAQNDIKIVDSIDSYTSEDPKELEEAFEERGWGPSVLIVTKGDDYPTGLVKCTKQINHVNLMPTVGLNTLSLCKHETLVLTLDALREVEDKLLFQLVRVDLGNTHPKYRQD